MSSPQIIVTIYVRRPCSIKWILLGGFVAEEHDGGNTTNDKDSAQLVGLLLVQIIHGNDSR